MGISVPAGVGRRPRAQRLAGAGGTLRVLLPAGFLALVILAAIFAPLVAPYDPTKFGVDEPLAGPSTTALLGTDQFGRDILSRIVWGARATMEVAIGASVIAALIGVPLGLVGGYFSRWVEQVTMRVSDIILCFPPVVLAILVVTMFGPGVVTLMLVIAILAFPPFVRIVYAETVRLKRVEFVEASRALGAGHQRVLFRTILPNCLSPIIVQLSLTAAGAILLESGLSFLGLGVVPPTPSWGLMIREARPTMGQQPLNLIWPCLVLVFTVLAMNGLGDVVRDALDPRLRGSRRRRAAR